jgi:hypothetical protein
MFSFFIKFGTTVSNHPHIFTSSFEHQKPLSLIILTSTQSPTFCYPRDHNQNMVYRTEFISVTFGTCEALPNSSTQLPLDSLPCSQVAHAATKVSGQSEHLIW